mgnify:CR=1 FL=1
MSSGGRPAPSDCNSTSLGGSSGGMVNDPAGDWVSGVFVEGIGINATSGAEGLGSAIFEWALRVDPARITPGTFDLPAVRSLIARLNPSHCRAFVVLKNQNGGNGAVFDDPNTPFDGGTFA